jgi:hypothetical protein
METIDKLDRQPLTVEFPSKIQDVGFEDNGARAKRRPGAYA